MPNWFQRRRERRERQQAALAEQELMKAIPVRLQRDYWRFDAEEKARLLLRYPDGLGWAETLRLHHLVCMELLKQSHGAGTSCRRDRGRERRGAKRAGSRFV